MGSGEWGMGNRYYFPLPTPPLTPHSPTLTIRRRIPHSTPSNNNLKDDHCMRDRTFSLFHQVAPPKGGLESKQPLLLMLLGYGSKEDDMFCIAPYLDGSLLMDNKRARLMLSTM